MQWACPIRKGQSFPRICWRVSSAEPCRVKAGAVIPCGAILYAA
nr:MAG TPA: hypothetical protein [Caudoviricetes sp.]